MIERLVALSIGVLLAVGALSLALVAPQAGAAAYGYDAPSTPASAASAAPDGSDAATTPAANTRTDAPRCERTIADGARSSTRSATRSHATKAGRGLTDGERVGIVREAFQRKGDFGLGTASRSEADDLGRDFVWPGFTRSKSKPDILISADRLRKYRPPSYKRGPRWIPGESRAAIRVGRPFNSNGHLSWINDRSRDQALRQR